MSSIRPCRVTDLIGLAGRLRDDDKAEMKAMSGFDPEPGLLLCWMCSQNSFVGVDDDDVPIIIFGWTEDDMGCASIWMLATDQLKSHRVDFVKKSIEFIDRLNEKYPVLYNSVDSRNKEHIRWIKWMGFTVSGTRNIGVEQRPFLDFIRIVKHV